MPTEPAPAGPILELPDRIGLISDIHGNENALSSALNALDDAGIAVAVQLGDFGVLFRNTPAEHRALERMEALMGTFRTLTQLYVVHGNHDPIPLIVPAPAESIRWVSHHQRIGYLARGARGRGGGRSILFAPGAGSVDLDYRTEGKNWWPEETLSNDEIDAFIAHGPADVILAHDAPTTDALDDALFAGGRYWPPIGLEWAQRGRSRFDRLHRGIRPLLTVSGHYHLALDTGTIPFRGVSGTRPFSSRSVILPEEAQPGAWQVLNLPTLELEQVAVPADRRAQRRLELRILLTELGAGHTDTELADRLGMPRHTFSAIRSGHIEVSTHLMDRLRGGLEHEAR